MTSVIASGAKQSRRQYFRDCFVATLLAMTKTNVRERLLKTQHEIKLLKCPRSNSTGVFVVSQANKERKEREIR